MDNVTESLETMSEKDWITFFDLIEKIVDSKQPVSEKTAAVVEQAHQSGGRATMNFEEFTSWDFDSFME